jgi:hypothetical protein
VKISCFRNSLIVKEVPDAVYEEFVHLFCVGLKPLDVYAVEIVGGSSRVPAVKNLIKNVFDINASTTLNQVSPSPSDHYRRVLFSCFSDNRSRCLWFVW